MISKKELKSQCEALIDYEDLSGEKVIDVLNDLEKGGANIYWGCIPDSILNETF